MGLPLLSCFSPPSTPVEVRCVLELKLRLDCLLPLLQLFDRACTAGGFSFTAPLPKRTSISTPFLVQGVRYTMSNYVARLLGGIGQAHADSLGSECA